MTSLYDQSVPLLVKYLHNLSGILQKGAEYADQKGMKHEELLNFKLYEDMKPLTYQVQACSNTSKFFAVRVGGIDNVVLEDNETTFEQLHARIKRTIDILDTVDAKAVNSKLDQDVMMETSMGNFKFNGHTYVHEYTIPFFHFHLTTAYCILRHLGVPVGAFDYMKDVFHKA